MTARPDVVNGDLELDEWYILTSWAGEFTNHSIPYQTMEGIQTFERTNRTMLGTPFQVKALDFDSKAVDPHHWVIWRCVNEDGDEHFCRVPLTVFECRKVDPGYLQICLDNYEKKQPKPEAPRERARYETIGGFLIIILALIGGASVVSALIRLT